MNARPGPEVHADTNALVIFSPHTDMKWLKGLKAGYRHCFVAIRKTRRWVLYNPLSHRTEIDVLGGFAVIHLIEHFSQEGCITVPWTVPDVQQRLLVPMPYTCVEAVKRLIGVRQAGILTPWQLYRHLAKVNAQRAHPDAHPVRILDIGKNTMTNPKESCK